MPERTRITQRFPALVPLRLAQRRVFARVRDRFVGYRYAQIHEAEPLPVLIHEHSSVLERTLDGVDPQLQRNKVTNLRLASQHIDGIVIAPGQTFSFWRSVGRASKRRGYQEGLVLRDGSASAGVGGGLCQIANMLHWLALHSDLEVAERHRHSFDPFPDSDRQVPFGTGASLLEFIYDLKLRNPTDDNLQLRLWLTPTHLVGQLRSDAEPPMRYEVLERDHRFVRDGDSVLRCNRIVRRPISESQESEDVEVTLFENRCRVGYPVADRMLSE